MTTERMPDEIVELFLKHSGDVQVLYERLMYGTSRLSLAAVERFARMPGPGAELRARQQLQMRLEHSYEAVANVLGEVARA